MRDSQRAKRALNRVRPRSEAHAPHLAAPLRAHPRRLKAKKEQLKEAQRKYEKTEEDLKALQVRANV